MSVTPSSGIRKRLGSSSSGVISGASSARSRASMFAAYSATSSQVAARAAEERHAREQRQLRGARAQEVQEAAEGRPEAPVHRARRAAEARRLVEDRPRDRALECVAAEGPGAERREPRVAVLERAEEGPASDEEQQVLEPVAGHDGGWCRRSPARPRCGRPVGCARRRAPRAAARADTAADRRRRSRPGHPSQPVRPPRLEMPRRSQPGVIATFSTPSRWFANSS